MTELKALQIDIKNISELVNTQLEQFEMNPCHNEYMALRFNTGVLSDKLKELDELFKFNK